MPGKLVGHASMDGRIPVTRSKLRWIMFYIDKC